MSPSSGELQPPTELHSRGYSYGALGVPPYIPLFDPLVLLAGLAFLAYLIQTIHSIFATQPPVQNTSLLGGVIDSVVPTRTRTINISENKYQDIIHAIKIYDIINKQRKKDENSWWDSAEKEFDTKKPSTILVPVVQPLKPQLE